MKDHPERIDRRTFLGTSAALTGAAVVGGSARAQYLASKSPGGGNATKVTVALFLRGGADALNLYAPTGDPDYALLRPGIAIGAPGSSAAVEGLPLDAAFSIHPAMVSLHAAFTSPGSSVGIVHAVGHLPYNRSHFESQDLFETGTFGGADGWINRHLQATATPSDPPVRALALRASLPRSMAGLYPCYAVQSTADLAFQSRRADERAFLEAIVRQTPTVAMTGARQLAYGSGIASFDLIDLFAGVDPTTYVPSNGAVYPASPLGSSLREIAEIIKQGLGIEFFAVDQGGWDHHSDLTVRIAANAADLDQSVSAFLQDLGPSAADVVLVGMSEFGREASENGSGGCDHGVGGAMLLAGGPIRGGQMLGNWPGLSPAALQDGRFLRPVNDFRDVLLEILTDHMGGTNTGAVFPGHVHAPIGII